MNIAEHLKKAPIFADLNDRERERIAGACRRRVYRGRVNLFYEGDSGGQLYMVLRGGVKIYSEAYQNGQETTLALLTPGEVFGELALLTGGDRTASAVTIAEETELLLLDQVNFHALLRDSFDLTSQLLRSLAMRLKQTNENLVAIASNSSLSRVSKLLLARADAANGRLCPALSQAEIGHLIGVRRETVARILAKLEASACLLRNRGQIVVTDRSGLERISQVG